MKKTILRIAGFAAAAALLFMACDDNGLNRSAMNDGWANGFIKRFNNVNEQSVPHKVTVVSEGQGAGGENTYWPGIPVTITAGSPPNDDMEFIEWTSNSEEVAFEDPANPTTRFNMPAKDVTVTARFAPKPTFKVTYDLNGGQGTAPNDEHSYKNREEVVVRNNNGFENGDKQFAGWNTQPDGTGDSYGSGASLYITENTTLYALWASGSATLHEVIVINGSGGRSYPAGEPVTITANQDGDEQFTRWNVNSENVTLADATNRTTTFVMPGENVEVEAVFEKIPTYQVRVMGLPQGTIVVGHYKEGDTVTLNAGTPPDGKEFSEWTSVDGIRMTSYTSPVTTFIMPGKMVTVTANFKDKSTTMKTYILGVGASPTNGGTVKRDPVGTGSSGTTYAEGVEVTVTATPAPGYTFKEWLGAETGKANPVKITMNSNKTLTAVFEQLPANTYLVTVTGGLGASGGGSYAQGATVSINAGTAPNGQRFKNWTVTGGVTLANANTPQTTFTMPGNAVTVTAVFEAVYQVTVSSAGTSASGGGSYAQGATVSINAGTPPNGQRFKNWTTSSSGVIFANANIPQTTFTMPGNAVTVTAVFEFEPTSGKFTDSRDDKQYKYVTIGEQVWMAENLNHDVANSWCYDNDNSKCQEYGRLYTWGAANAACPTGWHLPSYNDWSLVGFAATGSQNGAVISKALRGKDWSNGDDTHGFNALPGGYFDNANGGFSGLTFFGKWWSSTPPFTSGYEGQYIHMGINVGSLDYTTRPSGDGLSVRCVRD